MNGTVGNPAQSAANLCRLPHIPSNAQQQKKAMKNKSIISLFVFLLGLSVTTTSCEDMLTPDMDRYSENFTGHDTVNFYFGILGTIQGMVENNVLLSEMRGDLADTTMYVSDTISRIAYYENVEDGDNALLNRAAYYKVINQCNFYLAAVDTMAQKYNEYYMRRECAQVEMVRAWVYMQLVQHYGRVPFVTRPVNNANTGWETNPEDWATPENLKSLLFKAGLKRAYAYEQQYGRPNYGTFKTGAVDIPHSQTVFAGDLIMAELCLLSAKTQTDYMEAATYYYNYLKEQASRRNRYVKTSYAGNIIRLFGNNNETYSTIAADWRPSFDGNYSTNDDVLTLVPSAANSRIGKTLTRIQQVYGFNPSSSSYGTENSGGSGEEGRISITADYKNRQLAPSKKYRNLNESQSMAFYNPNSVNKIEYIDGLKDARYFATMANVRTDIGILPFIQKFTATGIGQDMSVYPNAFTFSYSVPLYRIRQVYLRFAEAINRAGYPRHAFAILRDGLNYNKMPTLRDSVRYIDPVVEGEEGKGVVDFYTEYREDGANYIDANELRRAQEHPEFLDFSTDVWNNVGVHRMGGSYIIDEDTLYNYGLVVGQRMLDEAVRTGRVDAVKPYADKLMAERYTESAEAQIATQAEGGDEVEGEEGDEEEEIDRSEWPVETPDPVIPEDLALQQNAVETLIADEMALETAFEGDRFFDLTRMALHKEQAEGGYGVEWFAWMIARRAVDLKPYEEVNVFDSNLFTKLLVRDNWYLPSPRY